MPDIDSVVFLDAERGHPDRGWNPDDVASALDAAHIPSRRRCVRTPAEIQDLIATQPTSLFWPLDYTFDRRPRGLTMVEVLHALRMPYVGCNPAGAAYTSKICFKHALIAADISTPAWAQLDTPSTRDWTAFPAYVKTEYSCESLGVRRATTSSELQAHIEELHSSYGDRMVIEEAIDQVEATVACVVIAGTLVAAALEVASLTADHLDTLTKAHNHLLRSGLPPDGATGRLLPYAAQLVAALGLTGYFRLDVVAGDDWCPQAIDLNILPSLNGHPTTLSYLPMAFMRTTNCEYSDVVGAILASASGVGDRLPIAGRLTELIRTSSLLPHADSARPSARMRD
jgi:D-alanine-D-alanine ligase-like ATP-grasp enzyme